MSKDLKDLKIAVIGLGYVGLPLAAEFGKQYRTLGFDINESRVSELRSGVDRTEEVDDLASAVNLTLSASPQDLAGTDVFIVSVPTPIDEAKQPDMTALRLASRTVGEYLSTGNVVIYESTVYPGATEEVCVPILEEVSGLQFNSDFFAGYSPERINPGDREHKLPDIVKVTSGSTPEIADFVDRLYSSIVPAGTHKAPSIRVAEAAKVIENTQRDLNIALVNELAMLFDKLNLDTHAVLEAAGTKWNFLPFKPGLVGGHCIGVDPYYLTYKALQVGFEPKVILAGRGINDGMGQYIVTRIESALQQQDRTLDGLSVLILGYAFKEDCGDYRNTRVGDIVDCLHSLGANVEIYDPHISRLDRKLIPGRAFVDTPAGPYDVLVVAVAHQIFIAEEDDLRGLLRDSQSVLFDVKKLWNGTHESL